MSNTKSEMNVNYRLWVIIMCQCKFSDCNTCTTLVGDADRGGGSMYVGAGSIWENAQFCCETKTALKK